jgi:lysophospholipase L1-like esterase
MIRFTARFLLAITLTIAAAAAPRADDFLPAVHRILFLGDSITYDGQYIDDIETTLRLHLPDRHFDIINCGLPSETVSGLSEPGHADGKFPRPNVHERLDRVLSKTTPDLILACYGMNDGIYLPLSDARFEAFKSGMIKLHEKAAAAHLKIIHITPPVFDPEPIRQRVATADKADAAHPYASYDDVLDRYSQWLVSQRKNGWQVIDLHTAMNTALADRRKQNETFSFSQDGIHPNPAGHWIMARAILEGLSAPTNLPELDLEQNDPKSKFAKVRKLVHDRTRLLTDAWLTETKHQRPMPTGLPLNQATEKAAEVNQRIEAIIKEKITSP